jgi:DNA-binding response OmpR family regulator
MHRRPPAHPRAAIPGLPQQGRAAAAPLGHRVASQTAAAGTRRRVLIADDEHGVRLSVERVLGRNGFKVTQATSGVGAVEAVRKSIEDGDPFSVVFLDVRMPGGDGYNAVTDIRNLSHVPVIMLSALGDAMDQATALDLGADDYIVKPFDPLLLVSRANAQIRRQAMHTAPVDYENPVLSFSDGALVIDTKQRIVYVDGEEVELPAREYALLAFLATHPQQAFTHAELLVEVWGSDSFRSPATLTEHVRRIRSKIDSPEHKWIRTMRNVGYRFAQRADNA